MHNTQYSSQSSSVREHVISYSSSRYTILLSSFDNFISLRPSPTTTLFEALSIKNTPLYFTTLYFPNDYAFLSLLKSILFFYLKKVN